MILVDTSVLIDSFRGASNPTTKRFNEIRAREIPFGINNYIYQELLLGAATVGDFETLSVFLITLRFYNLLHGRDSHESAALLYFRCRKKGLVIRSTIDFLIAQTAIEHNLLLLHNDSDFTSMAKIIKKLIIY